MIKVKKDFCFWKPVPGFENEYKASILCVINIRTGAVKKPTLMQIGYRMFSFHKGGFEKKVLMHRLLATLFKYNPPKVERTHINHKNGIKDDNRIDNLEWVTQAENNLHAYRAGLRNGDHKRMERRGNNSCAKKVGMYKNGKLEKSFDCKLDAQDYVNSTSVLYFIKNKKTDPRGYSWRFL